MTMLDFFRYVAQARSYESTYDTKPLCRGRNRRDYIGQRPHPEAVTETSLFLTLPTAALCAGCWAEVELVHGRIPEHPPGPPPYHTCPQCGRPCTANYNNPPCSLCASSFESEDDDGYLDEAETAA